MILCSDCIYWDDRLAPTQEFGLCRRRAPTVIGSTAYSTVWPTTLANDWCGEAEAKRPYRRRSTDSEPPGPTV